MSSPIRFTGLFSGMDTQSMVNQLMRAENLRMDRLTRRRQIVEWRRDDLRGTMNRLEDFRMQNVARNQPNHATNVLNPSFWNTTRTEVTSGGTASNGITVSGTNTARTGSLDITVLRTAQNHIVTGRDIDLSPLTAGGPPMRVWELMGLNMMDYSGLNNDGAFNVTVNGTVVALTDDMTVQAAMETISREANVNMRFDSLHGRIIMESNDPNARITITDHVPDPANLTSTNPANVLGFFEALGFGTTTYTPSGGGATITNVLYGNAPDSQNIAPRQAIIEIRDGSGLVSQRTSDTNRFLDVEGLTIDLNVTVNTTVPSTDPTYRPAVEFNVNVSRNVDDTMEAIREFINQYNEIVRYLNNLHSTPRPRFGGTTGRFYEPLTSEQREAMSDREIERWEERARTGLHHRDSNLRVIQQQMRQWIQTPVRLADGSTISLHEIGITTGYGIGSERLIGMLHIDDEDRLREALESRGGDVQALFTTLPSSPAATPAGRSAQLGESGLAIRLNNIIENATGLDGSIRRQVGREGSHDSNDNLLTRRLQDYDSRISDMQRFLIRRENHFFAMFARMEQAMAQSNAQMDSLWAFAGM